jgi:hypothetical protein
MVEINDVIVEIYRGTGRSRFLGKIWESENSAACLICRPQAALKGLFRVLNPKRWKTLLFPWIEGKSSHVLRNGQVN